MDGQSDLEIRMIGEAPGLEVKTEENGKTVIRGYAAVFDSDSQDLGGFVERVLPGAFDDVLKTNPDVFGKYNHSRVIGRTSSGTMKLTVDSRGLRYEISPPKAAADVVELIERGDVRGSSFAFRTRGDGERWYKDERGRMIREIRKFDFLGDAGPVDTPAYLATETYVSKRALDMARGEQPLPDAEPEGAPALESRAAVSLKPTAGMAAAAKRGLALHEAGRSGDGLKPETVARANRLARREEMNEDWVREMNAWFARHASDQRPGWDTPGSESPGFVAHLLWGGTAGKRFSARKVAAMDRAEGRQVEGMADDAADPAVSMEDYDEQSTDLTPNNLALLEATEQIAEQIGLWPQEGPNGAHYIAESPFVDAGMRCSNCLMFEGGGRCEVVEGDIAADGICKLWVIPASKLSMPPAEGRSADVVVESQADTTDYMGKIASLKAAILSTPLHGNPRTL